MNSPDDSSAASAGAALHGGIDWQELKVGELLQLRESLADEWISDHNEANGHGGIFGGQFLGQALMAAARTVPVERKPLSLQLWFARAGKARSAVQYQVERLADGATTSTRSIKALQLGKVVCAAGASFSHLRRGLDLRQSAFPNVPAPEQLPTFAELVERHPELGAPFGLGHLMVKTSVDLKLVDPDRYLGRCADDSRYRVWLKTRHELPAIGAIHEASLAYATDYVLAFAPPLARVPLEQLHRDLRIVSVNHGAWFFEPFRADDWLLIDIDCPASHIGRGFAQGKVFTRDGTLVALVNQELRYQPLQME